MIVIDNFLDNEFLKEIEDNKDEFFTVPKLIDDQATIWWDGWWKQEARNLKEVLIEKIMRDLVSTTWDIDIFHNITGFEYWAHTCSDYKSGHIEGRVTCPNDWHTNHEETAYKKTQDEEWMWRQHGTSTSGIDPHFKHPFLTIVFYPIDHDVEGSYLELSEETRENGNFHGPEDVENLERIKPVYNRLVVFDSSRWHKVSPIISGDRYAITIDIWDLKCKDLYVEEHCP